MIPVLMNTKENLMAGNGQQFYQLSFPDQKVLEQVVTMIDRFTNAPETFHEMLSQTVEGLVEVMSNQRAVVLTDDMGNAAAFAALWPLLETAGARVDEFGSWIVREDLRHHRVNGMTVGEAVCRNLVDHQDGAVISTIKRMNSLRGLEHAGFEPIHFSDFPMLTTLTCVCTSSELEGENNQCDYRRGNNQRWDFVLNQEGGRPALLPCTLVTANKTKALATEDYLRGRYQEWNGGTWSTNGVISRAQMLSINHFYEELRRTS